MISEAQRFVRLLSRRPVTCVRSVAFIGYLIIPERLSGRQSSPLVIVARKSFAARASVVRFAATMKNADRTLEKRLKPVPHLTARLDGMGRDVDVPSDSASEATRPSRPRRHDGVCWTRTCLIQSATQSLLFVYLLCFLFSFFWGRQPALMGCVLYWQSAIVVNGL